MDSRHENLHTSENEEKEEKKEPNINHGRSFCFIERFRVKKKQKELSPGCINVHIS